MIRLEQKMRVFTYRNFLKKATANLANVWATSGRGDFSRLNLLPYENVEMKWNTENPNSVWTSEYMDTLSRLFPTAHEVAKVVTLTWVLCTELEREDEKSEQDHLNDVLSSLSFSMANTKEDHLYLVLLKAFSSENASKMTSWTRATRWMKTGEYPYPLMPSNDLCDNWVTPFTNMLTNANFGCGSNDPQ